jgi:hypothetical protein
MQVADPAAERRRREHTVLTMPHAAELCRTCCDGPNRHSIFRSIFSGPQVRRPDQANAGARTDGPRGMAPPSSCACHLRQCVGSISRRALLLASTHPASVRRTGNSTRRKPWRSMIATSIAVSNGALAMRSQSAMASELCDRSGCPALTYRKRIARASHPMIASVTRPTFWAWSQRTAAPVRHRPRWRHARGARIAPIREPRSLRDRALDRHS